MKILCGMHKNFVIASALVFVLTVSGCGQSEPNDQTAEPPASAKQESTADSAPSVNVETVGRQPLQSWIYGQGTARSRQREFLTFTQEGVVSHIDENLRVGVPVKAGQLIAHQAQERVNADLQAAKASLAEAQASLDLAKVTQQRYETLIEQRSASRQELDEAVVQVQQASAARDNARAQLAQAQLSVDESRLVAPVDGVLARLNIEQGRYFMPSTVQTGSEQSALRTVPALVIDPHRFEVRVELPSYNYREFQVGARARIGESMREVTTGIDPVMRKENVEGQVYAISPSLDPGARTFEVIIHTREEGPGLLDGEFVGVWIMREKVEDALVVPLESLRFRQDQAFVFVVNPEMTKVVERRVELGQYSGNYRAVLSGVEEGEQVVTDGRAALHDGQAVRVLQRNGNGR
ncbi:MAG TPA: efflux RND transporter periplasmic adaptor subunit [Azoarcus sp.]|nr:efflux RND transporter periplasmic adaptor subunit [Azoarcus sp.]